MQKTHDVMRNAVTSGLAVDRRAWLVAALVWLGLVPRAAHAQLAVRIKVAAASNLKFVLADLASLYQQQTGIRVDVNLGASGNLARQMLQGLPVEQFISADEAWVTALVKAGRKEQARSLLRDLRTIVDDSRNQIDPDLRSRFDRAAGLAEGAG